MLYLRLIIIYILIQILTEDETISDIFKCFIFILFLLNKISFILLFFIILTIIILDQLMYNNKILEKIFRPKELIIEDGIIKLNKKINLIDKYNIDISTIKKGYFNKKNDLIMITSDIRYPVPIIVEGKLIYSNLKSIKKNIKWLYKVLDEKDVKIDEIKYSYYQCNKLYIITN